MRKARWWIGVGVLLFGIGLAEQARMEAAALAPTRKWARTLDGPAGGNDDFRMVAVDEAGNVYVTATSYNGTYRDALTAKYDADGNLASGWPRAYNGAGNRDDIPMGIAAGADGSVYVAVTSYNGTNTDCLTLKYDADGNLAAGWPKSHNGSANRDDTAAAVAVDADGSVYVAGSAFNSPGNIDFLIIKYDPAGNVAAGWPKNLDGGGNFNDFAANLVLGPDGSVYVTGLADNGSNYDVRTVKYDASGAVASGWPKTYRGRAGTYDYGTDVAVDADGNVYVTGRSIRPGDGTDYQTLKYDAAGNMAPGWPRVHNTTGSSQDIPEALALDADGNVYVTGTAGTSRANILTLKYGPDGTVPSGWPQAYDLGGYDPGADVEVDADGNVYVTGAVSEGSDSDLIVLRYAPDGSIDWSDRWEDPAPGLQGSAAQPRGLVVDSRGQVYVAGMGGVTTRDLVLLKYGVQHAPDAESFSITTRENTPAAATLKATDQDGDTLSYTVVDAPDHGSLSGTAPGLTYSPDDGYVGADSFTYKASDGTNESGIATVSVTVSAIVPAALTLSPASTVKGGNSLAATLTLDAAAPAGGILVDLASSGPAASVPATVTVAAGLAEATFTVTTTGVAADTPVTLSASRAGTDKTAELTVEAAALRALTLTPARVVGGRDVQGRVFLDADAPAGGLTVSLATAHGAASVPADVTVAPGARWADFAVTTSAVTADTTADVEATWNGVTRRRALTVVPLLAGLTVTAPDRVGGRPRYAVVTLNGAAPAGGALLEVSSDDPALAPPPQVTVAEGKVSLRFLVVSAPVASDTTVTLTARHAGRDVSGTAKVLKPQLVRLRGRTSSVGGRTLSLYADLDGPAPVGGLAVALQSDDAAATVPAHVTVPGGAIRALVPVRLARVSSSRTATVTATLDGVSKTLAITITP